MLWAVDRDPVALNVVYNLKCAWQGGLKMFTILICWNIVTPTIQITGCCAKYV